jgi:hypothetical protein
MGFFGKIKNFFGFTGVKIEITKLESPFPITDPVYKAEYEVQAANDVSILEITHIVYAKRLTKDANGEKEEEIILDEESTDDYEDVDVKFPYAIKAGETFKYGLCLTNLDIPKSLAKWGVQDANTANIQNVKFFVKVEVDIKETAFAFDPEMEAEFEVK